MNFPIIRDLFSDSVLSFVSEVMIPSYIKHSEICLTFQNNARTVSQSEPDQCTQAQTVKYALIANQLILEIFFTQQKTNISIFNTL